jgi:ABC-type multidrug transport system ATPase subunit
MIIKPNDKCTCAFEFKKPDRLKLQAKCIAIAATIFIFLALFFSSSALYAANESNQPESSSEKSYNSVIYQFINDNEYLFTILSGIIAGGNTGGSLCGVWCAIGGGLAGATDEALVYFEYTDRRYLTWCIYGISIGHVIKPSLVFDTVGGIVGILVPTGILNNKQELISPAVSAVAGNLIAETSKITSGRLGGVLGGLAGTLDEISIYTGITDKHYLTFCIVGMAAVNMLKHSSPAVANSIGVVLGLITVNYEGTITAVFLLPIKTTEDLYTTYGKFIPKEQLDDHIEKHAIALIGGQFLTQLLSLKIIGYQQGLTYNFERLDNPSGLAWRNLQSGLIHFVVFIVPYAIGQAYSRNIDDYFCKKLHRTLESEIRSELFFGETALRLSHDGNSTVLMDNLKNDVSTTINSGSWLVTGAVSSSIGGAYGVGILVATSPRIFVYSTIYNKASSLVSEYLSTQQMVYGEKIAALDSKLTTILKHDVENVRTITERDGIAATKWKIQQISTESRELEELQKLWDIAGNIWWPLSGTTDSMLTYYLVGMEINNGNIAFIDRIKVQAASWKASNFLSWSGQNAREVGTINQSLNRINTLEEMMHGQSSNKDKIDRIIRDGNQLMLKDLEIGITDKITKETIVRILLTVKDLKLDMGKVYAVTGETGCGKTSLLSKIKGIRENGISGKGYIYYPSINGKDPKIIMLSQQEYFPLDSSLYEVILYPDRVISDKNSARETADEKREEIASLLKEIGLYTFRDIDKKGGSSNINTNDENKEGKENQEALNLDSKKDWYTVLSGGEKKKITIVSAIIKKPDILILDEIFNGLDPKSIIVVQRMLKKYLPNTLILSVDHHAQDNNYDFYDAELQFSNKSVDLRDITSKVRDGLL